MSEVERRGILKRYFEEWSKEFGLVTRLVLRLTERDDSKMLPSFGTLVAGEVFRPFGWSTLRL